MSRAKLRVTPLVGVEGMRIEVDCEHGTTALSVLTPPGVNPLRDAQAIAAAVARHYAEERCRCTRHLRLQYLTVRLP
jgi:hypothetical protein